MFKTYKNKKVLITGHTGFKGAWLSLWLSYLGADICGYSLAPNTNPSLFNILGLKEEIKHIESDIRDFEKLKSVIDGFNPDIIFHLAAQPLVRASYKDPLETYSTNVLGTANILEAARLNNTVKAFVNITTDKCYENIEADYAYKEDDKLGGHDPYSNSKACSELVTAAYRNSFFNTSKNEEPKMLLASARAGNVIGGGDYAEDRILPDFIRAVEKNESIFLRFPKAVRPWQFVLEPLSGYLLLGQKLLQGGKQFASSYNFGPEEESIIPVEDVIKTAIHAYGKGAYNVDNKNNHPHEAGLLKLNIKKAARELDWRPKYNVKEAIEKTITWYKNYAQSKDMKAFSLQQIKDFENK